MQKWLLSFVCALVFVSLTVNAQDNSTQYDPVEQWLDYIQDLQAFSAKFTLTISEQTTHLDNAPNILSQETGQLVLQQPNWLFWQLDKTNIALYANGQYIDYVEHDLEQVTRFSQAQLSEQNPLLSLLSQRDFSAYRVSVRQNPKGEKQFIFIHRSNNAQIQRLTITVCASTICQFILQDIQGQLSHYQFENQVINQLQPVSDFQFPLPTEYLIDDQRSVSEVDETVREQP